jgi:uncharacterized protein (TIRG00374 family)
MKKRIFQFARIFISLFLLGLLFFLMRDNLEGLVENIKRADINIFAYSLLFIVPISMLSALRFKIFLTVQGVRLKYIRVLNLVFVSYFFNNFMPSTVGGDVAKLYYVKKSFGDYTRPLSAIIVDRLTGLTALLCLATFSVLRWEHLVKNAAVKIIVISCSCAMLILIFLILYGKPGGKLLRIFDMPFLSKIKPWIIDLHKAVQLYRHSSSLPAGFILSLISHILICVYSFVLSKALYLDVPISIFLILTPVVGLMSSLPSLNGLGIRESAVVYFYKDFIAPEQALALSVLFLAYLIPVSIAGAIIYLFSGFGNIAKEAAGDKKGTA